MLQLLQILTVILVAVAMGLSLAHALELPGKLRLGRDAYVTIQAVQWEYSHVARTVLAGLSLVSLVTAVSS
jgi:hypothetical protein